MAKSSLLSGFLNINKASGMTAHDVVAKVRRICGIKQVGHAGTLDPMARGVLPIAIGKTTRLLRFLGDDKIYLASVLFGQSTDTDDIEGKVIATSESIPSESEIDEALKQFVGDIVQIPPMYSAIHVNGRRLYEMARKGEMPAEIPKRNVHVFSIAKLDYVVGKNDDGTPSSVLKLRIHCSSGTYIRSIARDLGEDMGSKACLSALEREKAGPFDLATAISLEELAQARENGMLDNILQPAENKLVLQTLNLAQEQCKRLAFGQKIEVEAELNGADHVLVLFNGKVMAVCSVHPSGSGSESAGTETKESKSPEHSSSDSRKNQPSNYNLVGLKPEVVLTDGSDI
ncbi:MAG: tRNA pseudouridine(55) synthase TruB [Candidatus Obscuribacterales bacterium]|nr:tRNA pseudouridine(55) synthase TruB [Candidatus Obscuribacterales bacterium]